MIFVTVGTQLPFDRLVRTVDLWASARPYADAFAQIGPAEYRPKYMPWAEFLDAEECRRKTEQADVVVAHAGMGSILTALELGRPILVMPRLSALREQRNDHQLDTAKKLLSQGRIFVAFDENQLLEKLEYLRKLQPSERIPVQASSNLLATLRAFITGQKVEVPAVADSFDLVSRDIQIPAHITQLKNVKSNGSKARAELVGVSGSGSEVWRGAGLTDPDTEPHKTGRESFNSLSRFGFACERGQTFSSQTIKSGLAAVILLAGRLRPTDLGKRIRRSRLDLPIDANRSLLTYWRDEVAQLAEAWGCKNLAIRVLLDQASPTPTLPAGIPGITLSVERDQTEFRGTGGVLRDVCAAYDGDAWVLVANAAQILFKPLQEVADKLAGAGGEINVVNESDGVPNGLMLLKSAVLEAVSTIGFHDMKEQVLPALARHRKVKVVSVTGSVTPPIHSLLDYTAALRRYHSGDGDAGRRRGVFDERWQSRFAIREQGSVVAASAVIHDSVVLEGAAVEKGAVLVRSVVGRGSRVGSGEVVIDQVVN